MKIIIGLGNPGKKYERTRHNAGFMVVDVLASSLGADITQAKFHALLARVRLGSVEAIIAKPQTYMNESGRAVGAILRDAYAMASDLIVIHDELDLSLGAVRVKVGGGHGGHNGLRSIIDHLGSPEFIRIRVGIGRPAPGVDAADYVLSPFLREELESASAAVARAAETVSVIIAEGPQGAMNIVNQK
jgi:PTH1 family peptidyl-tRNA hydrolase